MINAQLNLIVPIFIPANNSYKILSTVDYRVQLPSIEMEPNQDVNESINMLLKRYIKDISSVVPKLIDIQNHDFLNIYYMCYINYETTVINGVLKSIDVTTDEFPPNTAKVLSLLSRTL